MTFFERTLLEETGHGQGTGTSIGAGLGEEVECSYDGLLHITYTCPTPKCNSPSTESYGLIQYCNPESRQNCRSIQLIEASRDDLCDLHQNAHGTEQGAGRLHIIHRCPIEGCTSDRIDSQAVIKSYCDPKSGKMCTILGQVVAIEDKVCELHSKTLCGGAIESGARSGAQTGKA